MMSKKRICLIGQFPPPIHGLSKAVETLYRSKELNKSYDFIKVDITNNKKFISNYRLISKTNADLFYFTISQSIGGNLRDLLIMHLLRKQGKKCLIHLHGGYFRKLYDENMIEFQRKWNRTALKNVCGAIVLGNSLRYIFEGLVEDEMIFVVPNCVDDEFLLPQDELEKKLREEPEIYHVLYLSNFIKSKGYDIVLQMAKKYNEHPGDKKLHFDFAGKFYGDNEKLSFENYVKDNGLQDIVTYHGVVSGDAKRDLLKNSTFFALPTRYPKEGQPISILEAMGNGIVILTTNHAGIPDVVENEVNGCVKKNNGKLAETYLSYIYKTMNTNLKKTQKENYEKVISEYLERRYIYHINKLFERKVQ